MGDAQRYVSGNPIKYTDPSGNVAGAAILATPFVLNPYVLVGAGVVIAGSIIVDNWDEIQAYAKGKLKEFNTKKKSKQAGTCDNNNSACEVQHMRDTDTCNKQSTKAGRARCHASATNRYGACLAKKAIPPLVTW